MKELIEPVVGFELTTKLLIKHFGEIPVKIRYDIIDESFDGKPYKDLILYIPSGNSLDMFKIHTARRNFIEEITDYPKSFMGEFVNYKIYSDEFENSSVFAIRKYDTDTDIY